MTNATEIQTVQEHALALKELQDKVADKFPFQDIGQREAGFGGVLLDFVPINKNIERLNEVFPMGWEWEHGEPIFNGNFVILSGDLTVILPDGSRITRSGIGADKLKNNSGKIDMDKSVKTAMANAIKKASNTLGVALYLWNEDDRNLLAQQRVAGQTGAPMPLTSEQIEAMKSIRKDNDLSHEDIDKLVGEWSEGKLDSRKNLNYDNIDSFIDWYKDKK